MAHPGAAHGCSGVKRVALRELHLRDYRGISEDADLAEIENIASALRGVRVLHLNATSYGGGVAELLQSQVPLERDLGLDAQWWTINAPATFFDATKSLHNALQGMPVDLTTTQRALFQATAERQAGKVPAADIIVAHDPQVVALRHFADPQRAHWIWRCHIDLSTAHPPALALVLPFVREHDAAIFTMDAFVPPRLDHEHTRIIPPAIDPLSDKNRALDADEVRRVLDRFDIPSDARLLLQVARFDPWKDPTGVIDAYRLVRERVPGVRLALVGALADDDPEGVDYLERSRAHAAGESDIHILTNIDGVDAREVNAFQRAASVGILKSIREGFGLTVSESLWKGVPVVGGDAGGITLQISDGVNGFLVRDIEECADRCVRLLTDRELHRRFAEMGRETVRGRFLTTRLVRDHLRLYADLIS